MSEQTYPEPDTTLIGYARVSTDDQDCGMQIHALRMAGVHELLVFTDEATGRTFQRPGLREALKYLSPGGTLLFWKLDRLGRDLVEIILTANRLDQRGIKFRSLTEPMINTEARETPTGFMAFVMIAMFAEMESRLISERTKAGVKRWREAGGRHNHRDFDALYVKTGKVAEFKALRSGGASIAEACKAVGLPRTTHTKWRAVLEARDYIATAPVDDIGGDPAEPPIDDIGAVPLLGNDDDDPWAGRSW
jgi:serine recombinase